MSKYENYLANLKVLEKAPEQDLGNEFVQSGIIDKFSLQFELAWKLLQKTLRFEGLLDASVGSPRGIIKTAYSAYDFIDEETWLMMLDDRNAAQHVYDSALADRLVKTIIDRYIHSFSDLIKRLESQYGCEMLASL